MNPLEPIDLIAVEDFAHQLKANNDDIVLLDLSQTQTYVRFHIPSAIHLPIAKCVRIEGYAGGLAPFDVDLRELASNYGLLSGKRIYVYDDEGGGWAGRMIWLLDMLGVSKIGYIDGGVRAWLKAGLEGQARINTADPSPFQGEINQFPNVSLDEMREIVANQTHQIWDARSVEEFNGVRRYAKTAGHIPGAFHYDWSWGMDTDNASVIRPLEIIRAELNELGVDGSKPLVTYCQTHHRSGFTYLLGRLLGYSIRAYAGSWSEWGNQ